MIKSQCQSKFLEVFVHYMNLQEWSFATGEARHVLGEPGIKEEGGMPRQLIDKVGFGRMNRGLSSSVEQS